MSNRQSSCPGFPHSLAASVCRKEASDLNEKRSHAVRTSAVNLFLVLLSFSFWELFFSDLICRIESLNCIQALSRDENVIT